MTTTFKSKIGPARRVPRSRIWIEGRRLVDAGFLAKETHYTKMWNTDGRLILQRVPDDTPGALRVSGKGDKPIIDITGNQVMKFFKGFKFVAVNYKVGQITITGTTE